MRDLKGRTAIVEEARLLYTTLWPCRESVRETRACLFHAVTLQGLLATRGLRTMIQAGSCRWPMRTPEQDDGVSATHFAYVWEGVTSPAVLSHLLLGRLPEMHVWLAHRAPDTIIDPTAGTWPERAAEDGHEWTSPRPPAFLWHTPDELKTLVEERFPLGIEYAPTLEACEVADDLAQREIYPVISRALGLGGRRRVR